MSQNIARMLPVRPAQAPAGLPLLLRPEVYRNTSLMDDVAELCDPALPVRDPLLVNVVVKYFFSYVHEGAHNARIHIGDVTRLFDLFSRHQSLNEDGDDIELMNSLRQWSFALRMLADVPKTCHILRSIVRQKLPQQSTVEGFVSLDIGTGSGVLMLAQYILGRRLGFDSPEVWGIEYDQPVAERTGRMAESLGFGRVARADARNMESYGVVAGRKLSYVSNETISATHQRLRRERFVQIFYTLFDACKGQLRHAAFFPEGLIVYSKELNVSVMLSRENGFQGRLEYQTLDFYPQALFIEGQVTPLHLLGEDFLKYLSPEGLALISRRW